MRCLNSECTKHMRLNAHKDNIFALAIDQALEAHAGNVQYEVPAGVKLRLTPTDLKLLKTAVKSACAGGDYHPTKGFGVLAHERVCGGGGAAGVWLRLTKRLAIALQS